jgi:hypothetical protein
MIIAMIAGATRIIGKSCSVDGCDKPHWGNGFCRAHNARFRRHGSPTAGRTPIGEKLAWLRAHVSHDSDECLPWPFTDDDHDYGRVKVDGSEITATRYMCLLAHGEPPTPKHEAAHSCGNPECRNARHLRWATTIENNADKLIHGTDNRGEKHNQAKLTAGDVHFIRASVGVLTSARLAMLFGVTKGAIKSIKHRRTWGWLSDDAPPKEISAPSMVTAWEPTPDELARLNAGAPVHLRILGSAHPPVLLTVGEVPE